MALIVQKLDKGGYLHTYTAEPPVMRGLADAQTFNAWRDATFAYWQFLGVEPAIALALLADDLRKPFVPPPTPEVVAEEAPADDDEGDAAEPPRKDWTACNAQTGECE